MERNGTIRDSLDELADTRIVGFLEDVRRPVAKYPAVADDIDVVGDAGGLGQVMYAAIDLLIDKLDRQLIKHKEKYLERQQGVGAR